MNAIAKNIVRPFAEIGLNLLEGVTGFKTDPTGFIPNRWKMLSSTYENFLVNTILSCLPPDGIFIDVGANVGYISKCVAKAQPNAKIISVEPNPRLKPILAHNLGSFASCNVLHIGLGSNEDVLEFYQGKDSAVGSFVKGYNEIHHSFNPIYQTTVTSVPVHRGDIVFKEILRIDIMKVDVEGFELEVFKGFEGLFSKAIVKNIAFEFRPMSQRVAGLSSSTILDYLINQDFQIVGLEDEWKDTPINKTNIERLIQSLGEGGYTTLHAKLNGPKD